MNADIRITVLRRTVNEDFYRDYATVPSQPCERLQDGQQFVSHGANMPEGFCSGAWCDIQKYVLTLARGGDFIGTVTGVFVTCCTDGYRPVFFKIERV